MELGKTYAVLANYIAVWQKLSFSKANIKRFFLMQTAQKKKSSHRNSSFKLRSKVDRIECIIYFISKRSNCFSNVCVPSKTKLMKYFYLQDQTTRKELPSHQSILSLKHINKTKLDQWAYSKIDSAVTEFLIVQMNTGLKKCCPRIF